MKEILNLVDLAVAESASVESLSSRLSEDVYFTDVHGVGSDAAVLAILRRDYPLAVSLLEQGRSAIFAGLGRYRSAIEDVPETSPELAASFIDFSAQLNALVVDSGSQEKAITEDFRDKSTRYGYSWSDVDLSLIFLAYHLLQLWSNSCQMGHNGRRNSKITWPRIIPASTRFPPLATSRRTWTCRDR